jgi:hypothetical protein
VSNSTVDEPMVFHLYFGCILLKEVPKLMVCHCQFFFTNFSVILFSVLLKVQVTTYRKVGKSYNKKETFTADLDFCNVQSVTTNSVFVAFLPDSAKQLATVFQPCPYSVGYV